MYWNVIYNVHVYFFLIYYTTYILHTYSLVLLINSFRQVQTNVIKPESATATDNSLILLEK